MLLLCLNNKTFTGSNNYISRPANILKACQTNDSVQFVLVQDKDLSKGSCDFGCYFSQAPQELINPPFTIFRDIAIPLYMVLTSIVLLVRATITGTTSTIYKLTITLA